MDRLRAAPLVFCSKFPPFVKFESIMFREYLELSTWKAVALKYEKSHEVIYN